MLRRGVRTSDLYLGQGLMLDFKRQLWSLINNLRLSFGRLIKKFGAHLREYQLNFVYFVPALHLAINAF